MCDGGGSGEGGSQFTSAASAASATGGGWQDGWGLSEGLSDMFGMGPNLGGSDPGGYGFQGGPDFTGNQQQAVQGSGAQPEDPNKGFWQQLVDAQRNTAMGSFDFMNNVQPAMMEMLGFAPSSGGGAGGGEAGMTGIGGTMLGMGMGGSGTGGGTGGYSMGALDQLLNQKYMSALNRGPSASDNMLEQAFTGSLQGLMSPGQTDQLINKAFTSSLQGGLSPASQVSFDKMKDMGLQSTATRGGMGGTGEAQLMGELAKGRSTMSQQDQGFYGNMQNMRTMTGLQGLQAYGGLQDMRAGRQQMGQQLFGGLQNMRTGQAMQGLQGLMNMRGGVMGQLGSGGAQEKYFAEKGWGLQNRSLDQNEPDMGGELLGTLLPMLGMGLMMSDIRLKHDIEYL